MSEPLLTINDLKVAFGPEDAPIEALRGVTLSVNRGECLGLVGESGSGKSLSALAAMRLLPTSARITGGSVRFRGREMTSASRKDLEGGLRDERWEKKLNTADQVMEWLVSGKGDPSAQPSQNPWVSGFGPADASSSSNSYGCFPFEKDKEVPSGDTTSDTYFEATAHNCVTDKCFQNDQPSCKKCEVHIKRSDNDDVEARLEDDPCGMCVAQFCQPVLTKCCDVVDTMMSLVKKCAYTALAENKAACYELRKNDLDGGYPDAGRGQGTPINESYQEQVDCFQEITNCYKNNCAGQTACKAP